MTSNLTRYEFLIRERNEITDNWEYEITAAGHCDSDAQAELLVKNLLNNGKVPTDIDGNPRQGLTIRRGDVEWYSTGV